MSDSRFPRLSCLEGEAPGVTSAMIWAEAFAELEQAPRGTINQLERYIGAPRGVMRQWIRVPTKYAAALADALGVPLTRLRPDLDNRETENAGRY